MSRLSAVNRRQLRYSERVAGEVGDGPDQGYSGGADSVPPAPHFPSFQNHRLETIAAQARQPNPPNKNRLTGRVNSLA